MTKFKKWHPISSVRFYLLDLLCLAHTSGDRITQEHWSHLRCCLPPSVLFSLLPILCQIAYCFQRMEVHFYIWTLQQLFEVIRVVLGAELFYIQAKWDEVRLTNLFNNKWKEMKLESILPIPSFSTFWNKSFLSCYKADFKEHDLGELSTIPLWQSQALWIPAWGLFLGRTRRMMAFSGDFAPGREREGRPHPVAHLQSWIR